MTSLKLALRTLRHSPGFTVVAIVTLALGIGLNTAMFSVTNTFILRPLGFPEPDRLFRLERTSSHEQRGQHSPANALDVQRESAEFADLALYCNWGFTMVLPDRPAEVLSALRISPSFFSILGVQPLLGRGFLTDEDQPGRNRVIVLSHRLWQSHFGGDSGVIGRTIRLDGDTAEIVGVMPALLGESGVFSYVQLYRPLGLKPDERVNRGGTFYSLLGRYRDGVTPAQAETRFAALASRLAADFPTENAATSLRPVPLKSIRMGDVGRKITFMLLSLSGFVLLIACANLANLLLARAISRAKEFAIRGALGASRLHLVRPIATECIVLALVGGAGGMPVYYWTVTWLARRLGGDGPPLDIPFDWRVMAFALIASLATSLFFGLAPAWLVTRIRVNDTLKSSSRSATGDRSHHRFRQALIVGQFALALVLLTGAAAFVRGLDRLLHQHAGWDPAPLVSGMISMPSDKVANPDQMLRFYQEAQSRLAALPGATGATVSLDLPTFGFKGPRGYIVEGRDAPPAGREPTAFTNAVSPEYFDVVGTHLLRGRGFAVTDARTSPPVVVINEAMARTLFPDGDAIGHRLGSAGEKDPGWAEIVGIAENVSFLNLGPAQTAFQLYKPLAAETWGYVAFTVKVANPEAAGTFVEPIRRVVAALDSDLPVMGLLPVPAGIERNLDDLNTVNQLLIGFGLLGLFLAALGLAGVIARLVAQRTNEIGIRMALGAKVRDVVQLILGAGVRMVAAGAVLGLALSAALGYFLAKSMPGLAATDAISIGLATTLLVAVALFACWLPARRASKVDPMIALRAE